MTFTFKVNRYDEISYSKGNVKDLALIQKRIIFEKPGRVFHVVVQVLFIHSLAMLQQRLKSITCKDVAEKGFEIVAIFLRQHSY